MAVGADVGTCAVSVSEAPEHETVNNSVIVSKNI